MSKWLIDSHFHLDYYKNHAELYRLINSLEQYTLCMTNSPGVYLSCRRIYKETTYLKFALGFHPQNAELSKRDFGDFLKLYPQAKYIGEVGLDFGSGRCLNRELQLYCFEEIVKKCALDNKLLSVHLRHSENEAIQILETYKPCKCIIHWFTGSPSHLQKLIDIGCYFSLNCNMCSNQRKLSMLTHIPSDKILIESDGPFTKVDGRKFSPEMLEQVYKRIAMELSDKELIFHVYMNFKKILTVSA